MTHQSSSDVLSTLVRGFWLVLLGLILGGALGALVSQQMTPVYRSNVYLLVVPESDNAGTSTANDYAQAYSKLVADPAVTGSAVSESEVGVNPWDVEEFVSVEVAPNAPILQITSSSSDPEDASTLANALGSGLSSFAEERAEDTGYQADVMAEAIPPEEPDLPDWTLNIAVGAATGLLVGGVVALLWDSFRQARKAPADPRHARQEEKDKPRRGLRQAWKARADQRQARQEEKDKQRLEREMAELEESAERYSALENDKQRLEREMAELEESVERYRALENDKQRLEREEAELEKQRQTARMAELRRIVELYSALENDKQRLEREMAELEESAERYSALENDKQRLEREMAELEESAERYRELSSNGLQKSHRGESGRDSTANSPLEGIPGESQERD